MDENELLTVEETARCLKISKATVYKMIKKNKLDSVMVNERNLRIPSKCLEKYFVKGYTQE
ncbi:helix-turn-helix domain-containing protein [Huintestinicola butyrica]|uniref:helix-turn-helix domain-containing protein n=1 Tax=Huintestinicola butyrica TaxID=2981728 RepID=UPI003F81D034